MNKYLIMYICMEFLSLSAAVTFSVATETNREKRKRVIFFLNLKGVEVEKGRQPGCCFHALVFLPSSTNYKLQNPILPPSLISMIPN